MNIITKHVPDSSGFGWLAWFEGNDENVVAGTTEDLAIANLIKTHGSKHGINVIKQES